MLCGYLPFYDENLTNLYSLIIFGELELPQCLNKDAVDLVKSLLNTSAKQRPTFEEILNHPWMAIRKLYSKDVDNFNWNEEYAKAGETIAERLVLQIMVP